MLFADRYDIVAVYRNKRPWLPAQDAQFLDPLAPRTELAENGRPIFAIQADLTQPGECEQVVDAALSRFGRIDLVVNSAASSIWAPMLGSNRLVSTGHSQLVTNVLVPLKLSLIVAEQFWKGREAENRQCNRNVVNVSSIAGLHIYPSQGQSLYGASKAALNHLTGYMAQELAPIGIRVNATAPNSFPAIVSTERAAISIWTLDEGTDTGTVVVVDGDRDEVIKLY
jgi:NAD(P)-dependent dehydrogenase (short-subunit alcohol dehydrogenase family)